MLSETRLGISFVVLRRGPALAAVKMSQAAYYMILQDHRWLPLSILKIAAAGSLKKY
jgi:hypothetical protein